MGIQEFIEVKVGNTPIWIAVVLDALFVLAMFTSSDYSRGAFGVGTIVFAALGMYLIILFVASVVVAACKANKT